MGIHIAAIEPGRDPYLKEVEPEDREGREASYLGAFQREVGGNVEAYGVLWDDEPLLYVNEEFLFNGSQPNRAIYANDHMEKEGYLSQMDYKSVVKAGVYTPEALERMRVAKLGNQNARKRKGA